MPPRRTRSAPKRLAEGMPRTSRAGHGRGRSHGGASLTDAPVDRPSRSTGLTRLAPGDATGRAASLVPPAGHPETSPIAREAAHRPGHDLLFRAPLDSVVLRAL